MAWRDWSVGAALLAMGGIWAFSLLLPLAISTLGGGVARQVLSPSGRGMPSRREYSHAESLVVRGLYQEAIHAFEVAIADDATDPTPYLRIARIYRDRMQRFEEASSWFKRALRDAAPSPGTAYLATRELVELYVTKLNDPRRAAPLLARMAEQHAGTPEGDWAAEQLAHIKAAIAKGADA
jgi:tetratricopeptide (TPR) repeat protein